VPVQKPSFLSPLSRARFWTRVVMVWERLLPGLFPYVLLALLVAVAGQWGVFLRTPKLVHLAILAAGLAVAVIASVRGLLRFRLPTFIELNQRIALDNGMKPERILAMRHQVEQPRLRVGKAKAGIAASDPFALRYVAVVAAVLGFMILGPVPLHQVKSAFCPFGGVGVANVIDMHLAEK
jgi:hypothetical protein